MLDSGQLFAMGWRPKTSLEDGLQKVYAWYLEAQGRTIQP